MSDSVLDVLRARAAAGDRPGRREDDHVVALVVEGGGMRGVVSAGMCAVLEAAGVVGSFDRIYGCSAGALAGCFTAAGQAAMWATTFEDTASRAFIDPGRALRRRPVLDMGYLFETVIARHKPLSPDGLSSGPAFKALAVSVEDAELRVLGDFADRDELLDAVRVSCTIPVLGGAPSTFRGVPMVDGGLLEPVPYRTALREGATHVLVLRTRHRAWRSRPRSPVAELAIRRAYPQLVPLLAAAGRAYNRDATELEALERRPRPGIRVTQVAVPSDSRLVGRLSTDRGRVGESLRLGAAAMTAALYGEPARLMWRPVVYEPAAATAG